MSGRHVGLVVEDDPSIAKILRDVVESLGHEAIHVTTRQAALAEIRERRFCYVLLDAQLPDADTSIPLVTTGLTLLKGDLRGAFPGRTTTDKHRMQIVIITGYSEKAVFVTRVMQEGADDFVTKPFDADLTLLGDTISRCLRHSERVDHRACAEANELATRTSIAPVAPPSPPVTEEAGTVRIFVSARVSRNRYDVLVDGRKTSSAAGSMKLLLSFAAARGGGAAGWLHVIELGASDAVHKALSRLRGEFRQLLAERGIADLLVNDAGRYRLDERIRVEIDEAFERQNDGVIRSLAMAIRSGVAPVAPKRLRALGAKNKPSGAKRSA